MLGTYILNVWRLMYSIFYCRRKVELMYPSHYITFVGKLLRTMIAFRALRQFANDMFLSGICVIVMPWIQKF